MNDISVIRIEGLTDAEAFINLLRDKRVPIVGACPCIDVDNEYLSRPVCRDKHIVVVPKRHSEIAFELLRSVEEDFPILY